jgi:hypothetical protein
VPPKTSRNIAALVRAQSTLAGLVRATFCYGNAGRLIRLLNEASWQVFQMAEEAVISELVSARLFPVTRENTGKFAISVFEKAKTPPLLEENSIA